MKRIIKLIALVAIVLPAFATNVHAQTLLTGAKLDMSNPRTGDSSNHVFTFTKASAGEIGRMAFKYCEEAGEFGDTCTATNVGGGPATLALVSFAAATETGEWTLQAFATEAISIEHDDDTSGTGTGEYIVTFNSVTNPTIADCAQVKPANSSTGTCFVRIALYDDSAESTLQDATTITMTITDDISVSARVDPTFTLSVTGVAAAATKHSAALTMDVTTTTTSIPFGNLTAGAVTYAGQDLQVVSNTQGGFTITSHLAALMVGAAYSLDIDPFAAAGVTDTNAVAWSSPTGTTAGTDTGWIGVSTDDADVTGQTDAEFFPLDVDGQQIAKATTTTTQDDMEIVYAIEVNSKQSADNYTGTLYYDAVPVY